MKILITLFLSIALVAGAHAKDPKPQPTDKIFKKACSLAKKEDKKVFVSFHASWCGWCKRMDSIMNMPETKPLFDQHFVIRHLVVQEAKTKQHLENPGGQDFLVKYNGDRQGIPFWLVFDAAGNLLADSRMPAKDKNGKDILTNVGCPAQPEEVEYFVGVLRKTTPLTDPQLNLIADRFILKPVKR